MKTHRFFRLRVLIVFILVGASILIFYVMNYRIKTKESDKGYKVIFLHHSTGDIIFNGGNRTFAILGKRILYRPYVVKWFNNYNKKNGTKYQITEQVFPKAEPYGWNNYPYDYYNIWVKNAGNQPYMKEPTLEILTKQYDLIILKHCFPVSNILDDINRPDLNSSEKRIENYKLQYRALKEKMNDFPNTKFIVWTGALQVEAKITKEQALRAKLFFDWVRDEWDTKNDNIHIWDFYSLETEGSLYLKPEFADSMEDSHPNQSFAKKIAPIFCNRIVEVIEQNK